MSSRHTIRQSDQGFPRLVHLSRIAALVLSGALLLAGCDKPVEKTNAPVKSEAPPPVVESALANAAIDGDLVAIKTLLDAGADINSRDALGRTPLHLAAATGQPKLSRFLIERGADPLSKDANGRTPLFYAEQNQHPQTSALLQQYRAKD